MAQQQQLLKFSVHHYRLKTIPEENFKRWLHEYLAPTAAQIIKKHNIVKWSVTLSPVAMQQAWEQELRTSMGKPPGWGMADYDITISYWVRDPDDMRRLLEDEDWAKFVSAVEVDWVDLDRASILVGYETVFVDGGEIVG